MNLSPIARLERTRTPYDLCELSLDSAAFATLSGAANMTPRPVEAARRGLSNTCSEAAQVNHLWMPTNSTNSDASNKNLLQRH